VPPCSRFTYITTIYLGHSRTLHYVHRTFRPDVVYGRTDRTHCGCYGCCCYRFTGPIHYIDTLLPDYSWIPSWDVTPGYLFYIVTTPPPLLPIQLPCLPTVGLTYITIHSVIVTACWTIICCGPTCYDRHGYCTFIDSFTLLLHYITFITDLTGYLLHYRTVIPTLHLTPDYMPTGHCEGCCTKPCVILYPLQFGI